MWSTVYMQLSTLPLHNRQFTRLKNNKLFLHVFIESFCTSRLHNISSTSQLMVQGCSISYRLFISRRLDHILHSPLEQKQDKIRSQMRTEKKFILSIWRRSKPSHNPSRIDKPAHNKHTDRITENMTSLSPTVCVAKGERHERDTSVSC